MPRGRMPHNAAVEPPRDHASSAPRVPNEITHMRRARDAGLWPLTSDRRKSRHALKDDRIRVTTLRSRSRDRRPVLRHCAPNRKTRTAQPQDDQIPLEADLRDAYVADSLIEH